MPDAVDPARVAQGLRLALRGDADTRAYGIVDATIDRDLAYEARLHFGASMQSLFLPEVADALWDVAPYLVAVDLGSQYLERWGRRWGASAGVLLTARAEFAALAEHLRSIFVVTDETGQDYFFRFYDPRVLRSFLPTCSPGQLEEFFGPIDEFFVEADDGASVLQLRREGARLVEKRVPLETVPAAQG